jgi:hypothetical protein
VAVAVAAAAKRAAAVAIDCKTIYTEKKIILLPPFHNLCNTRFISGIWVEGVLPPSFHTPFHTVSVSAFTYCRVQKKPDYANRFRAGTIFAIYQVKVLV